MLLLREDLVLLTFPLIQPETGGAVDSAGPGTGLGLPGLRFLPRSLAGLQKVKEIQHIRREGEVLRSSVRRNQSGPVNSSINMPQSNRPRGNKCCSLSHFHPS